MAVTCHFVHRRACKI